MAVRGDLKQLASNPERPPPPWISICGIRLAFSHQRLAFGVRIFRAFLASGIPRHDAAARSAFPFFFFVAASTHARLHANAQLECPARDLKDHRHLFATGRWLLVQLLLRLRDLDCIPTPFASGPLSGLSRPVWRLARPGVDLSASRVLHPVPSKWLRSPVTSPNFVAFFFFSVPAQDDSQCHGQGKKVGGASRGRNFGNSLAFPLRV